MQPLQHPDYMPVDLESFMTNMNFEFDLYLFNRETRKFVLFCAKDAEFTDVNRQSLLKNNVKELFISPEDYEAYLRYIEKNLMTIIENDSLKLEQRTNYVFQCADKIMSETIADPTSRSNLGRSRRFVRIVVMFIGKQRSYFQRFLKFLDNVYSISAHCINVCIYSIAIARKMNLSSFQLLETLGTGALLHDIGMTVVPAAILEKTDPLTADDWAIIRQHPEKGAELVKTETDCSKEVIDIIFYHHEKSDGSGYPQGVHEKDIPVTARIVSIADIFDAINSARPYHDAKPVFAAFQTMIAECKDKINFDVLREFIILFQERNNTLVVSQ